MLWAEADCEDQTAAPARRDVAIVDPGFAHTTVTQPLDGRTLHTSSPAVVALGYIGEQTIRLR